MGNWSMKNGIVIALCLSYRLLLVDYAQATTQERSVEGKVALEISQISQALMEYKIRYGKLPPSMATDDNERMTKLKNHLRVVFPQLEYAEGSQLESLMKNIDPAESMVLFLGGTNSASDKSKYTLDFLRNRMQVVQHAREGILDVKARFAFQHDRLIDIDKDGFLEYLPPNCTAPYVYFESTSYGLIFRASNIVKNGLAVAYKDSGTGDWFWPNSFQIIAAGSDSNYGSSPDRKFPDLYGLTDGDYDNLTNFIDVSFATLLLRDEVRLGHGRVSAAVILVFVVVLPPLVLMVWHWSFRFSLKQFLVLFTLFGLLFGTLCWDASHFADVRNYHWLLRRYCSGTAWSLLWISLVFTLLFAAKHSQVTRFSAFIYKVSIWMVPVSFIFVWWPNESSTLFFSATSNYTSGWPIQIAKAGQFGVSGIAIAANFLVGLSLGVIGRRIIWGSDNPSKP